MSRYIDADAIDYRNDRLVKASDDFIKGVEYANSCINNAPSIDIVRCKECNYHVSRATKIDGMKYCERFLGWTYDTDHCAWGERRE